MWQTVTILYNEIEEFIYIYINSPIHTHTMCKCNMIFIKIYINLTDIKMCDLFHIILYTL